MIEKNPKKLARTIVLVGDMNPKIFQPEWFAANKLLGREEVDNADLHIIHSDVVDFSTSWLKIQVLRERFRIETTQDMYFDKLRDLAISTFHILSHTPIKMMGLNYQFHYQVNSEENWNKIGDTLAPKEIWNDILT